MTQINPYEQRTPTRPKKVMRFGLKKAAGRPSKWMRYLPWLGLSGFAAYVGNVGLGHLPV